MMILRLFFSKQSWFGRSVGALVLVATQLSGCTSTTQGDPTSASTKDGGRPSFAGPLVTPEPPPPHAENPLFSLPLYVDPNSLAMLTANGMRQSDPTTAAVLDRIAQKPQGIWMGGWNSDIFRSVQDYVERAAAVDALPVLIAYNIPHRDAAAVAEGQGHAAGGLTSGQAYRRWIREFAAGIADRPAVVVLEPDALPGIETLTEELQQERVELIRDAVRVLRQGKNTAVYVDAGNPSWLPANKMAKLLQQVGVEDAHGFSINVSNYQRTDECVRYGSEISELTGGAHFVIDTSRNGAGPYLEAKNETESWCNPPGRKIGVSPTTQTSSPLVDAYLWLKRPGESDGECGGGPPSGVWWQERALEMVQ